MIGQHLLADLYDVASDRLVDGGLLADCLDEAARRGGMNADRPSGAAPLRRGWPHGLPPPLGVSHRVPHLPRAPIYRSRYFLLRRCRFEGRAFGLPRRPRARPRAHYHGARGAEIPSRTAIETLESSRSGLHASLTTLRGASGDQHVGSDQPLRAGWRPRALSQLEVRVENVLQRLVEYGFRDRQCQTRFLVRKSSLRTKNLV